MSEKRPVGSLRRDKDALLDLMGDEAPATGGAAAAAGPAQSAQDLLADIFGSGEEAAGSSSAAGAAAAKQSDPVNDIMSLFGSTSLSPQSTGPASASASASASNDLFSVMGTSSSPAAPTPAAPAAPAAAASGPQAHEAYNRNGLRITLTPVRDAHNRLVVNILAKFEATQPTSGVNFQAAVPKVSDPSVMSFFCFASRAQREHGERRIADDVNPDLLFSSPFQTQKLQMLAMSKTDVAPGSTETQQLRVMVPAPGALVRLRLRIAYNTAGGQQVQDQTDFAFPAELMADP